MKRRRNAKPIASFGTSYHAGKRRTAGVKLDNGRVQVVSCGPGPAPNGHGLPQGAALGDLLGVLHQLDLPPADDPTTPKLVAAQLEALIPGQAEHVRWGWQRSADPHRVLAYTVARRRIEALSDQLDQETPPCLVTTPALALHHLFSTSTSGTERQGLLVIGLDQDHLHLIKYEQGELQMMETASLPKVAGDDGIRHIADTIRLRLVGQRQDAANISGQSFTFLTNSGVSSEEVAAFEAALGVPYRRADGLLELSGLDEMTLPNLVAVGTALAAAQPRQAINLAPGSEATGEGVSDRPSLKRWAVAAGLLLGAASLLYVSDTKRADRLVRAVEDAGIERKGLAALNTDLQAARYLETTGPSFLAILDELSHYTEGFMVDELRYERDGQFTLQATSQSSSQVNQLAEKLSNMKTLSSVRIRNQSSKDRDKIEYTLVAVPAKQFMSPFAPPKDNTGDGNPTSDAKLGRVEHAPGGGS